MKREKKGYPREMECEIKLTGRDCSLSGAFNDEYITRVLLNPPDICSMRSVYYDFPDLFLSKKGVSLRFRLQNGKGFINVKTKSTGISGVLQRDEWECPGECLLTGLCALKTDDQIKRVLAHESASRLIPIATVEFLRTYQTVLFNGAEIELSLDRGFFNDNCENSFAELEAELISGEACALNALAAHLTGKYNLKVQIDSKLSRALNNKPI